MEKKQPKKKRRKQTHAKMLFKGESFEIVGLEDQYRNLQAVSPKLHSIVITGERLKDGQWIPLGEGYCIASTTNVRPL